MFGDPKAIALLCNLIELCPADPEMPRKLHGIQIFRKVCLDIFIYLHGKLLLAEGYHPFHAEVCGNGLHDMGSGRNMVFCNDLLLHGGRFQSLHVDVVIPAALLDLFPSVFMGRIGEDMAEQ